jgi:hypothetical protein
VGFGRGEGSPAKLAAMVEAAAAAAVTAAAEVLQAQQQKLPKEVRLPGAFVCHVGMERRGCRRCHVIASLQSEREWGWRDCVCGFLLR